MGAQRVTIGRRRGVAHYITHTDGSRLCDDGWDCVSLKPYPNAENDREWIKLLQRWERAALSRPAAQAQPKETDK
jgi:hypothetical protein